MKTVSCLFLFIAVTLLQLNAQTEIKKFIGTNGAVNAILQSGDTTYIGGKFTEVGININGLARFKPGGVNPDINFPELGGNSSISAIVSDDDGGSYLAGYFDNFDDKPIAPTSIIHISASGTLDSSFNPGFINEGFISILKKKNDKLYIGGQFNAIQGVSLTDLAILDATTGVLNSWKPDVINGTVTNMQLTDSCIVIQGQFNTIGGLPFSFGVAALDINTGKLLTNFILCEGNGNVFTGDSNTLYVAGKFTNVGIYGRSIAKVSAATAAIQNYPWTDGSIFAILADGNGGYFIGGQFNQVGNQARKNFAHILPDGSIDSLFNLTFSGNINDPNDYVVSFATDGTNLYIGGYFSNVNGVTRNAIAAVLLKDGTLTNFNPQVTGTAAPSVNSIIYNNGTLYLAGSFTKVNNNARNNIAALTVSNVLTSWNPNVNNRVDELVANSDYSSIFICGSFAKVNGVSHPFLAKVSTVTGIADSWLPSPNAEVQDMALDKNLLYISGNFTSVKSKPRSYLAAIDTSSNTPTSFKADADATPLDLYINSGKLYVAGNFTKIQGAAIKYIARINTSNGLLDSWNNNNLIGPDFGVTVVTANDSTVILGGSFYLLNTQARNNFAAIHVNNTNFELKDWNPVIPHFNVNGVYRLIVYGQDIFASGSFNYTYQDSKYMQNLIALNDSTGTISREFLQYPTGSVTHLNIFDDKLILAGGTQTFRDISGSQTYSRTGIAAYDLNANTLSSSMYEPNGFIDAIDTDAAGSLIIGGEFGLVNYVTRYNLASFNTTNGIPLAFAPNPSDAVRALVLKDTVLFAGGDFTAIGQTSVSRQRLAAVNTSTGEAMPWQADANSIITCLALKDSVLYAGGVFSSMNGLPRNHGAAVSIGNSAHVLPWNPNTNDNIYALLPLKDSVYVGGSFTLVNGVPKSALIKCNNTNGSASNWSPLKGGQINALSGDSSTVYAGGSFILSGTAQSSILATFDIAADTLKPFKLDGTGTIVTSTLADKYIYLGLLYSSSINGIPVGSTVAIDTLTGNVSQFNPKPPIDAINAISAGKTKLFTGGYDEEIYDHRYPAYFSTYSLQQQSSSQALSFSNVQPSSVDASWINGSATNRLVVVKQDGAPSLPADGKTYAGDTSFGKGDQTDSGSYVVYNGPASAIHVTNLRPNHSYTFDIVDYNVNGSNIDYVQEAFLSGNITTPCSQYSIVLDSSGSLNICPGSSVTLMAPQNFLSYLWSTGDTTSSITVRMAGSYNVTATDSNSCKATTPFVTVNATSCSPPTGLGIINISSKTATLNWQTAACAVAYQYQYRKKGTTAWKTGRQVGTSKTLTGLNPSTTYQWRMLTICRLSPDTLTSFYVSGPDFTTSNSFIIQSNMSVSSSENEFNAYVYPNPAETNAVVYIQGNAKNLSIILRDLTGRTLWKEENVFSSKIDIPLGNFPNAVYFIEIKNRQEYKTLRLIKFK